MSIVLFFSDKTVAHSRLWPSRERSLLPRAVPAPAAAQDRDRGVQPLRRLHPRHLRRRDGHRVGHQQRQRGLHLSREYLSDSESEAGFATIFFV